MHAPQGVPGRFLLPRPTTRARIGGQPALLSGFFTMVRQSLRLTLNKSTEPREFFAKLCLRCNIGAFG
jgi:hypothetical protein